MADQTLVGPAAKLIHAQEGDPMKSRHWIAGLSTLLLTQLAALAADTNAPNVPYAAGGVSVEGRDAMLAMRSEFNTELVFALASTGHYVADVDVRITNASGQEVLN